MANAIIEQKEFEEIKDIDTKLNILFKAIVNIRQHRRLDDLKAIVGGFMGGFTAMAAKMILWK